MPNQLKLAIAALCFILAIPVATVAHAARQVALVIGNDQYQNLPKLQKAVADAHSYSDLLTAKGFDQVILKNNLTRSQLDEAIASFLDQIEPGDTAVFVYSGHGWSDGTQNYIVGTDAPQTGTQDLLARISIPLKNGVNGIIDEMDQKGAALKVAVIDACRDNPFTPVTGKRSIGLTRGMTRIDPPNGTFVVFSAGAGQSALDRLSESDPDPNSVFTRVFVPAIQAGLTLQDAIKTTQEQVVALARSVHQDQKPAYYDEVIGPACLSANCNAPTMAVVAPAANAAPAEAEVVFWQSIVSSTNQADFESYLAKYPNGSFVPLARTRLAALEPPAPTPATKTSSAGFNIKELLKHHKIVSHQCYKTCSTSTAYIDTDGKLVLETRPGGVYRLVMPGTTNLSSGLSYTVAMSDDTLTFVRRERGVAQGFAKVTLTGETSCQVAETWERINLKTSCSVE